MIDVSESIKALLSKDSYNFDDLCSLVTVLRSEQGCPWDREQTNKSIRNCIIDETYEFIEGLDNDDDELMCEELGDVLFQVIFHSEVKSESENFDINDVIDGICKKMILRHPHVFGDINVSDSSEVLVNWENIKNHEKNRKTPYQQLDSVSKSLPSLMRCQKLQSKAIKNGLVQKKSFDELICDVETDVESLKNNKNSESLGKLLFTICALSSSFDNEAEETLYMENEKFLKSFEK